MRHNRFSIFAAGLRGLNCGTPSRSVSERFTVTPAGPVAVGIHGGPYDLLAETNAAIERWIEANGFRTHGSPWEDAWKISAVDAARWEEIRNGLRDEARQWLQALNSPPHASDEELTVIISIVAHLAYHLGAIRQIDKAARGPKEGTF